MPDGSVLVVADYKPGGDGSFGSALFRMVPGAESILLCDGVVYASKPFATMDGRAFVVRGSPGQDIEGVMRVDSFTVDEVAPHAGRLRTLWQSTGYISFIAGIFENDLIVYDVKPSGARLVLVDVDTGQERVLLPTMPAFASDFSLTNNGRLVFQNRDTDQAELWTVESLDLTSGRSERLHESRMPIGPRAWPKGEVLWNGPEGLQTTEKSAVSTKAPRGIVNIQDFASDGNLAVALVNPSGKSSPYVSLIDSTGAELGQIHVPTGTPFRVIGFLP